MIVYTAVFGYTDRLHDPQVTGNHEFICLTDQDIESDVWQIRRVPALDRPNRQSRIVKWSPPFEDWSECLWMDCNFTLRVDPDEIAQAHPEDLVNFRHRDRTRITDEAEEIIRIGKALPGPTRDQLASYRADGFDTDASPQTSLSNNGMLLMRNTEAFRRFSRMMLEQFERFTVRDQLACDYCAWKTGLAIGKFPGTFNRNPYAGYTPYNRPVNDH